MKLQILAAAMLLAAGARAGEMHVVPLDAPHGGTRIAREHKLTAQAIETNEQTEPTLMNVLPVAGLTNIDYAIPFYVDLDSSNGIRDFNCTRLTFNGHTGHDPYIRSFREQAIGVPVFAVRDGVVLDLRDGEPDENTSNTNPSLRANYVYMRHGADERSQYVHLKRNSITVKVGDFVPAGTQIGMVGSSGPSRAPHIHFETTLNAQPVEPMAGPCRAGRSYLPHQEAQITTDTPIAFGAAFSRQSFGNFRPAPFDDAPHTGTFLTGPQTIYFRTELANVGASTLYQLTLDPPGAAGDMIAAAGTLVSYDASLVSVWWGIQVDLNRTGTWTLKLKADHEELLVAPFTVVTSSSQIQNRPPGPFTVDFEAPVIAPGSVPVCRVLGPQFADPDYDVVSYRYRWTVNDVVVRDITSAARTDALARNHVNPGANLRCSVTASDGTVSAEAGSAFAHVNSPRRRAARK
jgi:Peptidase family M23